MHIVAVRKLRLSWGASLVVLLSCLPAAPALAAGPLSPCSTAPAAGSSEINLVSNSIPRTAVLHLPPNVHAGRALPLLIALHGANQNAAFFEPYSGFSRIADTERFAVLYPNAVGLHSFWNINDSDKSAANDVQFISDAIDAAASRACLDIARIYATGVSNGGGMAARLACQLSTRIAAIAPVAGGYRSLGACRPSSAVSVLEVHGTSDGVVPYNGTSNAVAYVDGAGSVSSFLSGWLARDRCRTRKVRTRRIAPQVLSELWSSCPQGAAVGHLEVVAGEHQLPGALPRDGGPRSTFSAPWLIWRFLRSHRRVAR
ncbi:MAG: alpha/beta hydrolase family esterase [Solirubrobacteraceae bacterium]